MKIYYPSYYNYFKCIAEKCRHSCCVGWEISVDEKTLEKYHSLGDNDILGHIEDGVIRLCGDGRCPFLDESGLCRIISRLGDDYTSVICREHPRFYHRVGERVEGGIGASCEEACRLILSSDSYAEFVCHNWQGDIADEVNFDTLSHREYIYSLLLDSSLSYNEKIEKIKEKYALSEHIHSSDEWREILLELEYLDENHRGLFTLGEGRDGLDKYFERFFAYLVFRHLSMAESYENLRARLGFCILVSSIFEGFTNNTAEFSDLCDFARIISEEIEYSEDNTYRLIFEFEAGLS